MRFGLDDETRPGDDVIAQVRSSYHNDGEIITALDAVLEAEASAQTGGDVAAFREALALWIDTVSEAVARPISETITDIGLLDDSGSDVVEMIRQGQA